MQNVTLFGNISYRGLSILGFSVLSMVLASVTWVATVTHQNANLSPSSAVLRFAVNNHVAIMLILVVLAALYGALLSVVLYVNLKKTKAETQGMLEIVMQFLGEDEKMILDHLLRNNGQVTQANISKLEGMHRVKAHRAIQKMLDKHLIDLTAQGKIRHVYLKKSIMDSLRGPT